MQSFCSQEAIQTGLPLYGTAVGEVRIWLALEYHRPWGAKALQESSLPPIAKEYLQSAEANIPHSRVQFIKQGDYPNETTQDPIFYVALTELGNPRTYRFQLPTYEALADLDLHKIIAGHAHYDTYLHDEPLFLVCTNGKRDLCCAKWGLPVYQAFDGQVGHQAWQTTHIGGHRYAATMVCLPHGICYGYLEPTDAAPLAEAYQHEEIWQLERYRGRTHYNGVTQAAEYFLRKETGEHGLNHFHWLDTIDIDTDLATESSKVQQQWQVKFTEPSLDNAQSHLLEISSSMSTAAYPASCDKAPKPIAEYILEKYVNLDF